MGLIDELDQYTPESDLSTLPQPWQPEDRTPSGFISKTLDFLSRPQYASARFFDTLAEDGLGAFSDALLNGAQEFISPKLRLGFSDLIKKYQPEFAKEHPYATTGLGFIGDVALDPTTYLSFGTAGAIEAGGKALSKKGALALGEEIAKLTQEAGQVGDVITAAKAPIRELAEKKILDMIDLGRTELLDKGGLKFAGKTLISGDKFGALANITGISRAANYLKETRGFEAIAKAFDRNFMLPQEFIDHRRELEASLDNSAQKAVGLVKGMLKLGDESLNKIGKLGFDVDDATRIAEEAANKVGRELTDAEASDIAKGFLQRANLNSDEHAAYMKGRQILDDIGKQEINAGLLNDTIKNYQNRIYESVKDAPGFLFYKKGGSKLGTFLGSSQERIFQTLDEAVAKGYKPEMNFATLLALRAQNSAKKIAQRQFNDWVDVAYKDFKEAAKNVANPHGMQKAKIWNRIVEDIQFIGNSNFPAGLGSAQMEFGKLYDALLRPFKSIATVMKPAFTGKQAISNSIQAIMEQGVKVHKAFNPLSIRDAVTALMYDSDVVTAGTPWAEKILNGVISNPLNEKKTIKELLEEAKSLGIISNTNLSAEAMKTGIRDMLKQKNFMQKGISDVSPGLEKALTGAIKYWNLPSHMENLGKLSLYINGFKLGYGPKQAAASSMRALFNYSHGMSSFERQILRRIIPFYSFQRFAIPFTAKILAQHPGRIQNLGDAAKGLFDGWNKFESGDVLNPDERKVIPPYMLEQPKVFAKMDDQMKAVFRTFNNFSPLETLGMIENNDAGEVDFKRSMYKMVLAQMAPMLKVPIELMVDKNFFTDQAISKEKNAKAGKIGKIDPNLLLGAMSQTLEHYGGVPEATDRDGIASYLKKILSWEVTPKGEVYINPTLAHIATSTVPILNQVFRMANPDKSWGEKAVDMFMGVGTQKIDLKKSANMKVIRQQKEAKDLQYRIRMAFIQGRPDEAELLREQLKELFKTLAQERALTDYGNIRGGEGM